MNSYFVSNLCCDWLWVGSFTVSIFVCKGENGLKTTLAFTWTGHVDHWICTLRLEREERNRA